MSAEGATKVGTDPLSLGGTGELAGSASAVDMPDIPCKGVVFKAAWSNAGNVYLGVSGGSDVTVADGSTDTTTGLQLGAGEATMFLPCQNLNEFSRICDNAGDDLTYLYFV